MESEAAMSEAEPVVPGAASKAGPGASDGCFRSPGPEATFRLGRALGVALGQGGGVIALAGELGAGKTLFVKGVAAGLGLRPEAVSSPTFVIAAEHPRAAGGALVHLDLYRLEHVEELEAVGFADALAPENVVAIEWADRFPDALPADRLSLRLERDADAGADARRLVAHASGERSRALLARFRARVAQEEDPRWH